MWTFPSTSIRLTLTQGQGSQGRIDLEYIATDKKRSGRVVDQMKIALNILGGLMVLFGAIWFLQGINVLPGSFMTGDIHWAFYGGDRDGIVGAVLLVKANRRREKAEVVGAQGFEPRTPSV